MGITDSKTGNEKLFSPEQIMEKANLMRGYSLIALNAAGSGHAGGTLSAMDIIVTAYLHSLRHDPKNPSWKDRDRFFFSVGHKAPAIYAGLAVAGYFPIQELALLRKFSSPLQGHPNWLKLKGLEISSGSLGQGLSIAVGSALNARLEQAGPEEQYRVFCLMGDGEQQEGQIWEAAMEAGHYKLNNSRDC